MKQILYAGDTHIRLDDIQSLVDVAIKNDIKTIVQVGDFGVYVPGDCKLYDWIEKRANTNWKVKIISCLGNHDNWDLYDKLCAANPDKDLIEIVPGSGVYFVRRGSVIEIEGIKHLFLGGALSINQGNLIEGIDWWRREEPDHEEWDRFFDKWEAEKPDTIVTHDAPLRIEFNRANRKSNPTAKMLEQALKLSEHKPKRWYFGHHHKLQKWKASGVRFYCCGFHGEHWIREIRGEDYE